MTKLVRCSSCDGKKQLLSLGNLMKECPTCVGIGWIETEEKYPEIETEGVKNLNGDPVKVRKKPGRKPKMQQQDMFAS